MRSVGGAFPSTTEASAVTSQSQDDVSARSLEVLIGELSCLRHIGIFSIEMRP